MANDRLHRLRRLLSTVRHLRLVQITSRISRQLLRPAIESGPPPPLRPQVQAAVEPADRLPFLTAADSFSMLGQTGLIASAAAWNDPSRDKLWLYHCHYFEDLMARGRDGRRGWHEALIERWVAENQPGAGNGWEAYPLSLRISHWVLWSRLGGILTETWRRSLTIQVRWLRRNIEWHVLGNHVIANAKALVLAGCWASGDEGERWLHEGLDLLHGQIDDQILPDGGHIERSPMYHCQVLNDLLDICNGLFSAGLNAPVWLTGAIGRMGSWLAVMRHPDGDIPQFNDCAFGMAPHPEALAEYAQRLGLGWPSSSPTTSVWLATSGYARIAGPDAVIFCDAAPLGPDWQPGHGHADTLTWEASLHGRRLVVDCGVSTYNTSADRDRQRGTAAHNTLTIDGADSSEVWGGFRVGRRARIFDVGIADDGKSFWASHDGYRRIGITHHRNWRLSGSGLNVLDRITGHGAHSIASGILLHPELEIVSQNGATLVVMHRMAHKTPYSITTDPCWGYCDATYHPTFGVTLPTRRLTQRISGELPATFSTSIQW